MDTAQLLIAPYGKHPETGVPNAPLPTQAKVLAWVDRIRAGERVSEGVPVLYVKHGVNSGGTRAILAPVLELLLESPGIRILWGRRDFNDLRLSGMETFFEVLPPELIAGKDEQEHRYIVQGSRGTGTIFFRELKDISGLGSQEFAVIVGQEAHEITKAAYLTLKQRCRQMGHPNMILLEGNPSPENHWLDLASQPEHPDFDPDLTVWTLPSYENQANMPPGYLASLERMPMSWRKRYVLGETGALPDGTPVYPAFVEAVHVRDTKLVPDRPIIRGWDFGLRRAACVWGQRTDAGQLLWHREWLAIETPETQFIQGVLLRTKEWFGERTCLDIGDPAATQRDPEGVSTLTRLQQAGVTLRYRQSTYGERIPLINRLLSEMVHGEPKLVISPRCKILCEALMGGYRYPELKDGQEFTDRKDVPYRDGWFEHVGNAWEYPHVNLFLNATPGIERQRAKIRNRMARIRQTQGAAVF